MSEKRPQKVPKSPKNGAICTNPPKPSTGRILGYLAQNPIPRAPSPPATSPLFVVSTPRNGPTRRVDPRTSGHLVQSEGSPARARRGPTVGPPGSPGRKKSFFPKLFPDHLGCSNTCFWPGLSPWWRVLGHGKSQNALKMGRFKTKNASKMGQKRVFPKVILDHFGCSNKCF